MVNAFTSTAILASLFLGIASAAPVPAAPVKRTTTATTPTGLHTGSASYFKQGQSSCNTVNTDGELIIALSGTHMAGYESSLCGQQVWIQNTGAFSEGVPDQGQGNTVIATVGDTCPDGTAASGGCTLDDIDLSPAALSQLTNGAYESLGRVNVKWGMVGDPEVPSGTETPATTETPAAAPEAVVDNTQVVPANTEVATNPQQPASGEVLNSNAQIPA